ncbi:MAG: TonB-dependent receptor, partial [Methylococcales bacterium]|nr:TonB-dependent receptor [Methylococcales bacterium]
TVIFRADPVIGNNYIYNVFAQDEIALDDEKRWLFTLGSKVEYYSMTRFEVEPSGSLSWHINNQHTLWTSVSHAVRTPARSQRDLTVLLFDSMTNVGKAKLPVMVQGIGKQGIDAENETAYQMGWRGAFSSDLTVDVTAFYASYNDITRLEMTDNSSINSSLGFPAVVIPMQVGNNLNAQTIGAELGLNWQTTEWWRNYLSYSFINVNTQPYVGHVLVHPSADEKTVPQHQVSLRTNFNVTHDIDFDVWGRYTDAIVANNRPIDSYFNTDVRVAWRPVKGFELSLIGQNLIQTNHIEWQGDFLMPRTNYVSRGVYAKFNWQF